MLVLEPTLNWLEVPTELLNVAVPAPEKVNPPGVVALMMNIRLVVPAMFGSSEPTLLACTALGSQGEEPRQREVLSFSVKRKTL